MITIALIPVFPSRYEEEMHSFGLSLALQPTPTRGCLLDSLCARVQARRTQGRSFYLEVPPKKSIFQNLHAAFISKPRPVSTSKCRIISAIRSENEKVKERLLCPSKGKRCVLLIECSVVGIVEGIRLITKLRTSRPVLPLRPFLC